MSDFKHLFSENLNTSRALYIKNSSLIETTNQNEQVLLKWREEIVKMDGEVDEFILSNSFIQYLGNNQVLSA